MGTIADLLGIDLQAALGQQEDQDGNTAPGEAVSEGGLQEPPADGEASTSREHALPPPADTPSTDEVVMAAVLAETALDPADAREDLTVRGDLDLDTIGLYAVVTAIEHGLGTQFTDRDVDSWQTLADLLEAARAAAQG